MRPLAVVAVAVLGVALGYGGARLRAPESAPVVVTRPVACAAAPIAVASWNADELRRIVREEVRAARPETEPAAERAAELAPEPTPPQRVAHEGGMTLLARARTVGVWTAEDVARLRELLPEMDEAQREQVVTELIPALNAGELRPGEGVTIPF